MREELVGEGGSRVREHVEKRSKNVKMLHKKKNKNAKCLSDTPIPRYLFRSHHFH